MEDANNGGKLPFDIDTVIERVRKAVEPMPKPVLFQLAEEGFTSVFEQLVACIITIRTMEEVSGPAARALFSAARTPAQVAQMDPRKIDEIINACTFHEAKAHQISQIARQGVGKFGGQIPCDEQVLLSFRGVGIKCTNLVLGIACGMPRIGVDIHVHRVTNRWGYAQTPTPEQTTTALEHKLPRKYWLEINRILVPFGKYTCTGRLPKCSTCPVLAWCRQVGVTAHR